MCENADSSVYHLILISELNIGSIHKLVQDLKIIRVKDGEIIDSLANPEHLGRIMERLGKLLLEDDLGSTGLEIEGYCCRGFMKNGLVFRSVHFSFWWR